MGNIRTFWDNHFSYLKMCYQEGLRPKSSWPVFLGRKGWYDPCSVSPDLSVSPWKTRARPRKNPDQGIRFAESYYQIDKNQILVQNISIGDQTRAHRTKAIYFHRLYMNFNFKAYWINGLGPKIVHWALCQKYKHLQYNNNICDEDLHCQVVFSKFILWFWLVDYQQIRFVRRNLSFGDTYSTLIIESSVPQYLLSFENNEFRLKDDSSEIKIFFWIVSIEMYFTFLSQTRKLFQKNVRSDNRDLFPTIWTMPR